MIHATDRQKAIIFSILSKVPVKFYAFGSRARGTHRKDSDLDLCFKEPLDVKSRGMLSVEFEESDLPFSVDVVDFEKASNSFKEIINRDLVELPRFSLEPKYEKDGVARFDLLRDGEVIGSAVFKTLAYGTAELIDLEFFGSPDLLEGFEREMFLEMIKNWK